jgi:hypothetical protein
MLIVVHTSTGKLTSLLFNVNYSKLITRIPSHLKHQVAFAETVTLPQTALFPEEKPGRGIVMNFNS